MAPVGTFQPSSPPTPSFGVQADWLPLALLLLSPGLSVTPCSWRTPPPSLSHCSGTHGRPSQRPGLSVLGLPYVQGPSAALCPTARLQRGILQLQPSVLGGRPPPHPAFWDSAQPRSWAPCLSDPHPLSPLPLLHPRTEGYLVILSGGPPALSLLSSLSLVFNNLSLCSAPSAPSTASHPVGEIRSACRRLLRQVCCPVPALSRLCRPPSFSRRGHVSLHCLSRWVMATQGLSNNSR